MRPQTPSGLQIGDVLADRAIIWSRTDRPARFIVERSYHEDFRDAVRIRGPLAVEASDFIARVDLVDLRSDRSVFVRTMFEDIASGRARSAPIEGRFRTAPDARRNVRFVWSADTAGQGFGINADWGGMRTYETMRQADPDFFIHCGDTIYADGPIAPAVVLNDGTVWRNVVTEETSKVAESLHEFRGRYRYNLMDTNVRRFSSEVPQIWQWDDHEVLNNWSTGTDLSADTRYGEKNVGRLATRARRAFLEYAPIRTGPGFMTSTPSGSSCPDRSTRAHSVRTRLTTPSARRSCIRKPRPHPPHHHQRACSSSDRWTSMAGRVR